MAALKVTLKKDPSLSGILAEVPFVILRLLTLAVVAKVNRKPFVNVLQNFRSFAGKKIAGPRKGNNKFNGTALLWTALFLCPSLSISGQSALPHYPDSLFSTYYHQKLTQFRLLPKTEGETIFLGNSITDGGSWNELFGDAHIVNRGISGDITAGVLNRLDEIVAGKPRKVFLMIGTNDLARGIQPDSILKNIYKIAALIHEYTPLTSLYVQSIFPVNPALHKFPSHVNNGKAIIFINRHLKENAAAGNYVFIDVFDALKDRQGHLNLDYTNDGLHLLGTGYLVWKHVVYPYVYGLQQKPSLIPEPQSLGWGAGKFPLYRCHKIFVGDMALTRTAEMLQRFFAERGLETGFEGGKSDNGPVIELEIGKVEAPFNSEEAYQLKVTDHKVTITGNTPHGVFNGIQTLRQLMRDGVFIDNVEIKDWPAFPWRGYMIDVGRNFQTTDQIRRQIEVMAHYKLNIFHFHLTENVAWRLQIKRYPQLTEPQYMTRNKGQYYTIDEMQELIQYCRDRFITLVPEIDMPGHSEAFKRAMGVDMQSREGLDVVKNILAEVDSTYDIPYIHIGADEVKFTNEDFLPEVVDLIHRQGKQAIGWAPGGNYDNKTIRQLWQNEAPGRTQEGGNIVRYIDSRGTYLNHKDPLSGVVSIFDKMIGDVEHGGSSMLGGEICLWNDIRAKDERDILQMNLAYPAILAMAERSWLGGGFKGITVDMGADTSAKYKAFSAFEKRLLDQKTTFFKRESFPYVEQADIRWKLFGPFENEGDSTAQFWPELQAKTLVDSVADLTVNGGTIWLRHFFAPVFQGSLKQPKPNTTWYAYRRIYSPADTVGDFWISFYNPSRSHAVETPKAGQWDERGSKLWINGIIISPPHWTYTGRNGDQESPLVDESYEYRPATKVHLKKGWNDVLVKAPVGSFQGKDWQHPVKWMFTVVRVR